MGSSERRKSEEGRDGVGGGGGGDGASITQGSRVISATTRVDVAVRFGELHHQILADRASLFDLSVLHDQILTDSTSFADLAVQHSDCSFPVAAAT